MFRLLLILSLLISAQCFAVNDNLLIPRHIKNQAQLARHDAKQYYKRVPGEISACIKMFLNTASFKVFLKRKKKLGDDVFKKYLKLTSHRTQPSTENQFVFGNGDVGEVCERRYGYCRGYTESVVLWNRLGHFVPEEIVGVKIPNKETHPEEWFEFYRKRIDTIFLKRDPVAIPGFDNLYMFSDSDPRITRYLKEHVARYWAINNVSATGVDILLSIKSKFTKKEGFSLYRYLNRGINELGYNPMIYLSLPAKKDKSWNFWKVLTSPKEYVSYIGNKFSQAGIHVVQAFGVSEMINGRYTISYWDIYNPHDAKKAIRTIDIDLNSTSSSGAPEVNHDSPVSFDGKDSSNTEPNFASGYADIEQIPFDSYKLGEDVKKLHDFYIENPRVHEFMLADYEDRLKNPRAPWYPPYVGEPIPPLIFPNGSYWNWDYKTIDRSGIIHLTTEQKEELPREVKILMNSFLGENWRELDGIDPYSFQIPKPFHSGGKSYKWNPKWIDHKGFITIKEKYLSQMPKALRERIELRSLTTVFPKYVSVKSLIENVGVNLIEEGEYWHWPLEWFDNKGRVNLPDDFDLHIPKLVKVKLTEIGFFEEGIKSFFPSQVFINRSIDFGTHQAYIPMSWIGADGFIKFPSSIDGIDEELIKFFVGPGIWPPKNKFKMSLIKEVSGTSFLRKNGELFHIPMDWAIIADKWIIEFKVPLENADYIPSDIVEQIISPAKWPFNKAFRAFRPQEILLSDGTKWFFPRSWINMMAEVNIPRDEYSMVPEIVKKELFVKGGPYQWPPGPIKAWSFQARPVRFGKLKDNDYYLWPRTWQTKDGLLIIPEGGEGQIPERVKERMKKAGVKFPLSSTELFNSYLFETEREDWSNLEGVFDSRENNNRAMPAIERK